MIHVKKNKLKPNRIMKRSVLTLAVLLLFGVTLSVTSCRDQKKNDNKVEQALDDAGDAVDNAADATGDALDDAGDAVKDAADDTKDAIKDATDNN